MVPVGGEEGIPIELILSKHRVVCEEALLGPEINLQITTHSNTPRGVNEGCFFLFFFERSRLHSRHF